MKSVLTTLLTVISFLSLSAQTVDEVIAKHIDAIGGKDVLAKTASIVAETSTSVMGNDAPGRLIIANGKGYKSEMDVMGMTVTQCVTLKGGWTTNPMSGGTPEDMSPEQAKGMAFNMNIGGLFVGYPNNGVKVELVGKKSVNKADAYHLKVSLSGDKTADYYIDATTYYIVKSELKGEFNGQATTITVVQKDYKKLDNGLVLSHVTEMDLGQFALTTTLTKVEVNAPVDEKVFDKP